MGTRGPSRRRRRGALGLLLAALCLVLGWAPGQTLPSEAADTLALVPGASDAVREGAIAYDHHCSACHGDTGGGLPEAKTSFPEEHRTCVRCHRPNNPPSMDEAAMSWRNAFDIGRAPALIGPDAELDRFESGAALLAYVQGTMPRPWPGDLDDATYLRITAFLLQANGTDMGEGPLTRDELASREIP